MSSCILYKIADTPEEFTQIHELNYQTFVEEIPQHNSNAEKQLIDKFNDENVYIIAKHGDELVGMICIRDQRPFSLDYKMPHLNDSLPPHSHLCEIRLLSVKKAYRHSHVFKNLILFLYQYGKPKGYDLILISGTDRQLGLYKRMGFEIFSDPVGTQEALYYPMLLSIEKFEKNSSFILKS